MRRNAFLLLLVMVGTLLALPSCARIVAASPDADGEIEIVMTDYAFEPDVIRLQVGQTVHLKLRNEGNKMHEFMAGRDVQVHGNFTEGFGEDFFAGLDPEITGPGMVMGMEGMGMDMGDMEMEGDEMEGDEHDEGGEMTMEGEDNHAEDEHAEEEQMPMEEGEHAEDEHAEDEHEEGEMTMEDEHAEGEGEEHDEEEGATTGEFGAIQMPLMDAHAGLMVMIDPQMIPAGEETTITFTVTEDKVGRWQIGCFQERGQHYDDGMNGVIIVEP